MQPQIKLIDTTVDDLVNSCQDDVEFRLPKLMWVRYLNDALMDMYDIIFIEAEAELERPEGQDYFEIPEDCKQIYMLGTPRYEAQNWDIGSGKPYDYKYCNSLPSGTYSLFDGKLTINKYKGNKIKLRYFRKPKFLEAINGKDKVDIPNEYIEAMRLYACAKAMQAEDETSRYQVYKSEYLSKKQLLTKYANRYRPERQLYWRVRR